MDRLACVRQLDQPFVRQVRQACLRQVGTSLFQTIGLACVRQLDKPVSDNLCQANKLDKLTSWTSLCQTIGLAFVRQLDKPTSKTSLCQTMRLSCVRQTSLNKPLSDNIIWTNTNGSHYSCKCDATQLCYRGL
ncbi:hypothetical protein DPMN_147669 [Dreissena polymorpha]|uniref:Uncharacterized protein n=1 Tax=Dreissena polymorpha TaxID=45954 RepID=A0A9D4F8P1_DREPO|nr:hypothetical protein DPMN_147669 [Dreissena polymorpha]